MISNPIFEKVSYSFEKLIVVQIVNTYSASYRTRRFITLFKTVRHWILSWTSYI